MKQWLLIGTLTAMILGCLPILDSQAEASCICTKQYQPVCGTDGKTYGNACEAKCAKVGIKHPGKCSTKRPCPIYRLAAPAPGCRYIYHTVKGCKVPKLICKARAPHCTRLPCRKCNAACQSQKRACLQRANNLNVSSIRRLCQSSGYASANPCLCAWTTRKASDAVILDGMRKCIRATCAKHKCCRSGHKRCYPQPANVQCVKAPCCRKLTCEPARCR